MDSSKVLGAKIVAVDQERRECRQRGIISQVLFIQLDNGLQLRPLVQETASYPAVDFVLYDTRKETDHAKQERKKT